MERNREEASCPHCGEPLAGEEEDAPGALGECPACGRPVGALAGEDEEERPAAVAAQRTPGGRGRKGGEPVEYRAHPALVRNNLLACLVCLLAFAAGCLWTWWLLPPPVIVLAGLWLKCRATTLTVTSRKTILRRGLLSRHLSEVWHADVRHVQVDQSLAQRLLGIGRLAISSAGSSGVEIEVAGVPAPDRVKELIDRHRN